MARGVAREQGEQQATDGETLRQQVWTGSDAVAHGKVSGNRGRSRYGQVAGRFVQAQGGARMISGGTGIAAAQPTSSTVRRPNRSASIPAMKLLAALTKPKLIRKERIAALLAR